VSATHGQVFAASDSFTARDLDGDAITQYDFWDTGSGGGYFALNGQVLGTNQDNYVSAAQLGQITYVSGSGTDTLWVRASDGTQWSPWSQSFTVTGPVDTGPTVTPASANINATHNQSFAASSLFTASDPFGDPITQYDFWDTGTGGGHFTLNGRPLGAGQDNYVSAPQLGQTTYFSGSGTDTLWVRVNEGGQWSPWSQSFTVTGPPDRGPIVTIATYTYAPLSDPLATQATTPSGINTSGQIVGSYDTGGFLLSGGTYTTLHDPSAVDGTTKWPRLSEQDFRFDRWSICRG
jgi:hypothetical protein